MQLLAKKLFCNNKWEVRAIREIRATVRCRFLTAQKAAEKRAASSEARGTALRAETTLPQPRIHLLQVSRCCVARPRKTYSIASSSLLASERLQRRLRDFCSVVSARVPAGPLRNPGALRRSPEMVFASRSGPCSSNRTARAHRVSSPGLPIGNPARLRGRAGCIRPLQPHNPLQIPCGCPAGMNPRPTDPPNNFPAPARTSPGLF